MKTPMRKFADSRYFIPATVVLYLLLAGLLFFVIGTWKKPDIEVLLTRWFARVLWADFLLIVIGVALCRRDIAAAFGELFAAPQPDVSSIPHPGPLPQGERERGGDRASLSPPLAEGARTTIALPLAGGDRTTVSPPLAGGDEGEGEARMDLPRREKGNLQQGKRVMAGGDRTTISRSLAGGDEGEGEKASWRRRLNRPGGALLTILIAGVLLVTLVAPQVHRIYYDEDIYANMGQNIAYTGQTGMANYATFEYGEYFVNWLLYNKDPSGWPFLIGLAFQLFGTDETYAFFLNNLLFVGGILVVFFITRIIAGGWFAGLAAALIYALIPHNVIWANTISAENSAAVFGGLAVLCTLVWLRSREMRHLFLLAAVLPFTCAMRPESALIGLWALAAAAVNLFAATPRPGPLSTPHPDPLPTTVSPPLAGGDEGEGESRAGSLRRPHPFATRGFWAMGLVSFALLIPLLWHFYAMSGESWGAQGAKFATAYFLKNLAANGFYYLNNDGFPVLFTLLAAVGLAAGTRATGQDGEKGGWIPLLMILLWFLLFWGIFLFFYAGSYKYGADVRFALVSFMPLAVLGGIGAEVLRRAGAGGRQRSGEAGTVTGFDGGSAGIETAPVRLSVATVLILVLIVSWLKFLPLIRLVGQEAWGARFDHAHAREFIKKIPNRAIVLTHIPTMFLLWGQNAIQTYAGINNPDIIRDLMKRYGGHVYFHKSYWCNTTNDSNRQICDGIVQRYYLEPVAVAREQKHEYGLYLMALK